MGISNYFFHWGIISLIYYKILDIFTRIHVTKKQASVAVLAVVFATAMIVSVIATSDNAFAWRNGHGKDHFKGIGSHNNNHKSNHQSISQSCHQKKSTVVTAGANSGVWNSGNNFALCHNINNGGNAAAF